MRKVFVLLLSSAIISGCSDNGIDKENTISYRIIKDMRVARIKRVVEVELDRRVSANDLNIIAKSIKDLDDEKYVRTLIGYKISGVNNGYYWATANYDPTLEVKIIGNSNDVYKKIIEKPKPSGNVIGKWLVSSGLEYTVTVYERDGDIFVTKNFGDGSSSDDVVSKITENGSMKLQSAADKSHGEFFVITKDGELELWGKNGKFTTAKKL